MAGTARCCWARRPRSASMGTLNPSAPQMLTPSWGGCPEPASSAELGTSSLLRPRFPARPWAHHLTPGSAGRAAGRTPALSRPRGEPGSAPAAAGRGARAGTDAVGRSHSVLGSKTRQKLSQSLQPDQSRAPRLAWPCAPRTPQHPSGRGAARAPSEQSLVWIALRHSRLSHVTQHGLDTSRAQHPGCWVHPKFTPGKRGSAGLFGQSQTLHPPA